MRVVEDLRLAARSLGREIGFAAVGVLTLALGLGAVTAVFAIVNAMYLVPLPYTEPDRLTMVWEDERGVEPHMTVAPANYAVWKAELSSFDAMAGFNVWLTYVTGTGDAERILGSVVTPEFFDVLGTRPAFGRAFTAEDARAGAPLVVVLSHGFWQRRFGADSSVIGGTVTLSRRTYTVIGVLPPGFKHPEPEYNAVQVWAPLTTDDLRDGADFRWMRVIGRLRPGVDVARAQRELSALAVRLEDAHPVRNRGWGARIVPLREELYAGRQNALLLVLTGAGLVLLVVTVNLANLMLARGLRKARAFAVRAALGATRARLVGLVLAESVVLSMLGGTLGVVLVLEASGLLRALQQRYVSALAEVRVDANVIGFVLLVSLFTALGTGVVAAFRGSRPDIRRVLSEGSAASGSGRGGRRARQLLMAGEVALSTILLVCTALLTRSFVRLTGVPTGFTAEGVLTVEMSLPRDRYSDSARVTAAYEALASRLRSVPNVVSVAATGDLPFTAENRFLRMTVAGSTSGNAKPLVEFRQVSADYFRVLGLPLLAGEVPTAESRAGGPETVVVNERFADRFWPGRSPVGQTFALGDSAELQVVVAGVVGNELDDGFDTTPEPRMYLSLAAHPDPSAALMIRTAGDAAALAPAVRREIAATDQDIALGLVRPLTAIIGETIAARRTALALVTVFGAFALALAAVGIYGVLAYLVAERTREIGLRVVLGASLVNVGRMVLGESLRLTALGIAVGAVASLGVTRILSSYLFGVTTRDPLSFAAAVATVGVAGLAATVVPLRRAIRIAPVDALRDAG